MKLSEQEKLEQQIVDMIKTCYDPEIPVDIYELGLIYDIQIKPDKTVDVKMTLTSPNCPVAGTLPGEVEEKVKAVEGIKDARVEVVWDPPWSQEMMSDEAKLELGLF
jgi:FeS assembly SUF system protein